MHIEGRKSSVLLGDARETERFACEGKFEMVHGAIDLMRATPRSLGFRGLPTPVGDDGKVTWKLTQNHGFTRRTRKDIT